MEKRVVVFLVLSAAVMFGWITLQRVYGPPAEEATPPTAAAPAAPTAPGDATAPGTPPAVAGAANPAAGSPGAVGAPVAGEPAAAVRPPEHKSTIERDKLYHAVFSSYGAAPVEFVLLDPQYRVVVDSGNDDGNVLRSIWTWFFPSPGSKAKVEQINMVKSRAGVAPFLTWLTATGSDAERSDVALPRDTAWTVDRETADEIVYSANAGDLHFVKRWTFPATGYAIGLSLTVENRGQKPLKTRLLVSTDTWHDPTVAQPGAMSFSARPTITEGICQYRDDSAIFTAKEKLAHGPLEALLKEPVSHSTDVRWVGYGEQFFLAAAAFKSPADRTCEMTGDGSGRISVRATFGEVTVPPGGRAEHPMLAYLGPKQLDALKPLKIDDVDTQLDVAVDYSLGFIARPMVAVLQAIHGVVVNWGVAVIMITLLLKLATLYPTQKSMESAKRMAKLKPEMDKIKDRFPDDKIKQSQAQQELFKQHGISPLGGCLPALFQMPIYIAFYSMLSNAVELYRAAFIWPITDMTAPVPAVSLVTGGLMFVQQLTSPQASDPQQRQMMYLMPVMFMLFTLFLPSGLTLYILTNTLLTMAHQWWMNRHDPKPGKPGKSVHTPAPKPARA